MAGSRLVVVTGGPFSGKTTLVRALAGHGHRTVPEAAIDVIDRLNVEMGVEGQRAWRSARPLEFQRMIFDLQLERERPLGRGSGLVFLDRGIADGIAYLMSAGVEPPGEFRDEALASRYAHAFVLETLEGFEKRGSSGRMSDREGSVRIGRLLARVYADLGVPVTHVGSSTLEERVETVLGALGARTSR